MELTDADIAKRSAAAAALELVEPGMRLGLGTGSTAAWFVELLGMKVSTEGLDVTCVPTSIRTGEQAEGWGIKLTTLDDLGFLDMTVDGADEFDPNLNLIKGGGGALLQEKIVAAASARVVIIADASKEVEVLGRFPLPVEIVPFGWETTRHLMERVLKDHDVDDRASSLRLQRGQPFITDENHFIVDLSLGRIGDPARLNAALNQVPGVVDTGLFCGIAERVIVGAADGTVRIYGQNT